MLDFGWSQMMLIAAVALIVLGPKELPRVIKNVTEWVGKARALAREFRASVDEMVRETDLKNIKAEFETAAQKAEAEFRQTIDPSGYNPDSISATSPSADAFMAAYDDGTPAWNQGTKLRGLMEYQRKKKRPKAAAKPVYKSRVRAPAPRSGPPEARRKVRA